MKDTGIITLNMTRLDHSHPPDPSVERRVRFQRALYEAITHTYQTGNVVYEEVARDFADVRDEHSFHAMRDRMLAWRRAMSPLIPNGYLALQRMLHSQDWLRMSVHRHGTLSMGCLITRKRDRSAIFGDAELARRFPVMDNLLIIASDCVKPDFGETETVLHLATVYHRRVYVIGWALLDNISMEYLREILSYMRDVFLNNREITRVSTNCDWRLKQAIAAVWPNCAIQVSFNQFVMAILHKAQEFHELNFQQEGYQRIIKKLICLSLLPPLSITPAFNWLIRSIPEEMSASLRPLFQWFRTNFIDGLTPDGFSFHDRVDLLQNGDFKIIVKMANDCLSDRPDLWTFYKQLLRTISRCYENLQRAIEGGARARNITTTPSIRCYFKLRDIRRLWELEQGNSIDYRQFLMAASFMATKYTRWALFQNQFRTGPFQPIEINDDVHPIEVDQDNNGVQDEAVNEINFDELHLIVARARPNIGPQNEVNQPFVQIEELIEDDDNEELLPPPIDWRCISCRQHRIEVIFRPCNCVVLCRLCADQINVPAQEIMRNCPLCRENIGTVERVFIEPNIDPNAEIPYDLYCQLCAINPIGHMSLACHELKTCTPCMVRWHQRNHAEGNRRVAERCPHCNIASGSIEVNFRRIDGAN